jgi:hypothetical protein
VEDDVPAPPDRRRLWVAVAATLVAAPLLLLDNLTADAEDGDGTTPITSRAVATVVVPLDRPETGPAKGISVVTTSTTSSTVPITVATTTTAP